jgi:hypothetical protein
MPVAEALERVVWPLMLAVPETERLVVEALVIVVWPLAVREDTVVVARVEVPVTANVPVVVAFVVVKLVMNAVTALRSVEKRLVAVNPVDEAFVRVVWPVTPRVPPMFALPEAETLVVEALLSVVCPETERVVAVVVARVEVPVTVRVAPIDALPVVVSVVNTGVSDTAIVLVPEKMTLAPATKLDIGLL